MTGLGLGLGLRLRLIVRCSAAHRALRAVDASFVGRGRQPTRAFTPVMPPLALALALALGASTKVEAQTSYVVIVSGLSGEEKYARDFSAWTAQITAVAQQQGVPPANITALSESGAGALKSTKANLASALQDLARRAGREDDVAIVLFGHGSQADGEARLNLSGPDLAATELATLLDALAVRRIIVVNTASASGGFIGPLAGPGRIIITATKSGMEQNETLFPRFFVEALAGEGADADRDGRVSMLEAFTYAKREVERAYQSDRRLLTEHATLEADGNGTPDPEPVAGRGDGAVARTAFLGTPAAATAAAASAPAGASAELRARYEEKRRLEAELEVLRGRREAMPAAEYQQALERLLLEVARNGQAIRRLEGGT